MSSSALVVLQLDKSNTTLQIQGARAWWALVELGGRSVHAWLVPGQYRRGLPPTEGEVLEAEPFVVDPSAFQVVKEHRDSLEPLGPKGAFRISGRVAFRPPGSGVIVAAHGLRFEVDEAVVARANPVAGEAVSFCVRLLCFRELEP